MARAPDSHSNPFDRRTTCVGTPRPPSFHCSEYCRGELWRALGTAPVRLAAWLLRGRRPLATPGSRAVAAAAAPPPPSPCNAPGDGCGGERGRAKPSEAKRGTACFLSHTSPAGARAGPAECPRAKAVTGAVPTAAELHTPEILAGSCAWDMGVNRLWLNLLLPSWSV